MYEYEVYVANSTREFKIILENPGVEIPFTTKKDFYGYGTTYFCGDKKYHTFSEMLRKQPYYWFAEEDIPYVCGLFQPP